MRLILLSILVFALVACAKNTPEKEHAAPKKDKPAPDSCVYPEAGVLTGIGSVMPNVRWAQAVQPDGTLVDFSLKDFYCNPAWDAYTSISFVIFAEWCPNCPQYLGYVEEGAAALEAAGSYLVLVDLETRDFELPSNQSAQTYVTNDIGTSVGLRAGDKDTEPSGLIHDSPIWSELPGGWVVRRSDMKLIANQEVWPTYLNWPVVASHLDADWSDPDHPPFFSQCGDGDEEASEPNDLPASAAPLAVGTVAGGICEIAPDYYTVSVAGDWQLDLEHDTTLGDLDIYVIQPGTNQLLVVDGVAVGSATYDGHESFTFAGEATVMVVGYMQSSAPYTLTLAEL